MNKKPNPQPGVDGSYFSGVQPILGDVTTCLCHGGDARNQIAAMHANQCGRRPEVRNCAAGTLRQPMERCLDCLDLVNALSLNKVHCDTP